MSDKIVSGGLLFTAVSLLTYSMWSSSKPKPSPRKRRYNPIAYKTTISTINEERSEEITQEIPITPNNTINNTVNNTPIQTQTPIIEENISELIILTEEKTISDEVDSIVENINKFEGRNSNTNSISSFLELNNTGSMTDTEELEFTKINETVDLDKLLKKIINNVIDNTTQNNVYGSPGATNEIPNIPKIFEIPNREEYKDKEYNSDLEDNDVNYFSDNESNRIKYKRKKKFFNIFKKRNKSI